LVIGRWSLAAILPQQAIREICGIRRWGMLRANG
jgi:hypothetical protein